MSHRTYSNISNTSNEFIICNEQLKDIINKYAIKNNINIEQDIKQDKKIEYDILPLIPKKNKYNRIRRLLCCR